MSVLGLDLSGRDRRGSRRLPYARDLVVMNDTAHGEPVRVRVRSVDISRGGMRLYVPAELSGCARGRVELPRRDGSRSLVGFEVVHAAPDRERPGSTGNSVLGVRFVG